MKRRSPPRTPCAYCGAPCAADVRASAVLPLAWPEALNEYHSWKCLWFDVRMRHPQDPELLGAIHECIYAVGRSILKEAPPVHPRLLEARSEPQERGSGCSHFAQDMDLASL